MEKEIKQLRYQVMWWEVFWFLSGTVELPEYESTDEKDYEKMKKIHEENSEYIYEESEEVEDE